MSAKNVVVNCIAKKYWILSILFAAGGLVWGANLVAAQSVDPPKNDQPQSKPSQTKSAQIAEAEAVLDDYESSLNEALKDPQFVKGRELAEQEFQATKDELTDAIFELRATHLRYRNRDERGSPERLKFYKQRRAAQLSLTKTFDAAMQFFSFGGNAEAIQYLVTMIENYRGNDIYNEQIMEAATRLIDGGQRSAFLFEAAARSAMVTGHFDLADRLYDAIESEELSQTDRMFHQLVETFETEYEVEQKQRELDAEVDLPRIRFETTQGDFVIELFLRNAPSTASHFVSLVESGFYDGLDFTQVIEDILALTGDPVGNGGGNSGQFLIDESQGEGAARRALRGSVVMAKIPTKDGKFIENSASSQFAILFLPRVEIYKSQTIIGRVIEGMDVVSRLRRRDPSKEKKKGEVEIPADQVLRAEIVSKPDSLPEPNYVRIGATSAKQ